MIESTDRTLLIKKDVCIYKIPPMRNSYGHKAADWNVNQPSFTGLLRIIGCEKVVKLRMEDQNDGKHAIVGLGFSERSDAFDFNVTLSEFFEGNKKVEAFKTSADSKLPLDLRLKEGQTLHLNIPNISRPPGSKQQKSVKNKVCHVLLPPPPSSQAPPTNFIATDLLFDLGLNQFENISSNEPNNLPNGFEDIKFP
ncbi:hypothetical protein HZS_7854 [Henneguya salminicola]|nr:hypothetical protein HZS_7854 [Henneguya salminicola]